jgi:hypothetical protein
MEQWSSQILQEVLVESNLSERAGLKSLPSRPCYSTMITLPVAYRDPGDGPDLPPPF